MVRWSVNRKYQRRDGNPGGLDTLAAATKEVKQKYFSDAPNWWSMVLLVTDRAFYRRGAAMQIVRTDISQADKELLLCGVKVRIMGWSLYATNGFTKLDRWIVHVLGDDESLSYGVMRCEPISKEQLLWR